MKPLFGDDGNGDDVGGGCGNSSGSGRNSHANTCTLDVLETFLHLLLPCISSSPSLYMLGALTSRPHREPSASKVGVRGG